MPKININQGTDEWKKYRQFKISATDAASILGLNPYRSKWQLWNEKMGLAFPTEENDAMRRGSEMEPKAREAFISHTGIIVKPAVIESEEQSWACASLDGISSDGRIAVEIKCGLKAFKQAEAGILPEYTKAQLQHQMMVCNLQSIYLWNYDGKRGILSQYHRDDAFIDWMIKLEQEFYEDMINFRMPSKDVMDPHAMTDDEWKEHLEKTWEEALKEAN